MSTPPLSREELERYHKGGCDKYIVLRGLYPNNVKLSGKPCSCGLYDMLDRYTNAKVLEATKMDGSSDDVHKALMDYGRICEEKGVLSSTALDLRMALAIWYREMESRLDKGDK